MTSLQELSDIEAIKQLKARYCLLLDAQDWEAFAALFTPDAAFDIDGAKYASTRAFVGDISVGLAGELHMHIAHMPIIEITGSDSARGLWSFTNQTAGGHYQEGYVRDGDGLRIAAMTMTWITAPSEELRTARKGQFGPVGPTWRTLAGAWGRPG